MEFKAIVTEIVGTFALIFVGAGTVAMGIGGLGAAGAHSLVVLGLIYTYGHYSGSHINPAVSFGLFVAREFEAGKMVVYWVAQCIGGILGAAALYWILGGVGVNNLGARPCPPRGCRRCRPSCWRPYSLSYWSTRS